LSTPDPTDELRQLAADAVAALKARGLTIATAEATTGGLIGHLLTSVAGSSAVFRGGVAPYSNAMKRAIGVSPEVLASSGAVSQEAAIALATAVRDWSGVDVGLAETGIAGPTGGAPDRPVGAFWIAMADSAAVRSARFVFDSDRVGNQHDCASAALRMLIEELAG
jgi:PncC family amidohydrolase